MKQAKKIKFASAKRKKQSSILRAGVMDRAPNAAKLIATKRGHTGAEANVWLQEANRLAAQKFSSVEEASKAIIANAAQRMQAEGSTREEMRETMEFLKLLFETDPALQERIRECFGITDEG